MQSHFARWMRPVAAAAAAALFLVPQPGLAHDPVGSPVGRSCDVWWEFDPRPPGMETLRYSFTAHAHAPSFAVNAARRAATAKALRCAEDHWESRLMAPLPESCRPQAHDSIGNFMIGYPTSPSLHADAGKALCDARPGADAVTVDIYYHVAGDTGCLSHYPWSVHLWVSNYVFDCPDPIGDGGADERADGPIGDGGDWDCVGEGCDGGSSDDAEGDGGAPAAFHVLPMFRLPGNDLPGGPVPLASWQQCRDRCRDTAACGAFTYRQPAGLCLLKRGVGLPIPDACCVSGSRQ